MKKNIKKIIVFIITIIVLLSALVYNLLYIKKQKNKIIDEIENPETKVQEIVPEEKAKIFVDVSGEVNNPGLYELTEGTRVNDAIIAAGGMTKNADINQINLAYLLTDAIKIIVPKKEVKKVQSAPVIIATITTNNASEITEKTNINSATKAQLQTLSGIGESTAQKIIDYRKENGMFSNIEAIKNVSGIGDVKFNTIKEKITI